MMTAARLIRGFLFLGVSCGVLGSFALNRALAQPAPADAGGHAEMSLRKSVMSREFQGRDFAGEEHRIARGDSLWHILVKEKGLPEKKFHSYLVVIRGLNPQIKNLDVLRIGDRIFIPLRLDDAEPAPAGSAAAAAEPEQKRAVTTVEYRVKPGEHIYRILREQLKLSNERQLAEYYALVKDLNPGRENWDNLLEGEVIRLPEIEPYPVVAKPETITTMPDPGTVKTESRTVAPQASKADPAPAAPPAVAMVPTEPSTQPPMAPTTVEQAIRSPARENMALFAKVAAALGSDMQQSGEEVVALPDGTLRFDKSSYPVIYNAALRQRVVIDPDGNIPASLKSRLGDPSIGTPVLPMANGLSLQDAVRQLLAGLGYQLLPADNPVVIQEAGIAFEAKGDWVALAPEFNNRTQEILVINIADAPRATPDYLKVELAKHGLSLREIFLAHVTDEPGETKIAKALPSVPAAPRHLPQDKREIVDALLSSLGMVFGVGELISVELSGGLRIDQRADRVFESSGKRTALFFRPLDPAIRTALQDKHAIRTVEVDVDALSSRDVIGRILSLLDDQAGYREHRFSAATASGPHPLTVKAWGFHIDRQAMFVTDRRIPPALHRLFFEKGLEIVYFR